MADQPLVLQALSRCPLFARADEATLAAVAAAVRRRRFRRNEVIFHQGDPADSLHVVGSGAVKISLPSIEGDEAIIATLWPGDYFGELALLDDAPRSATATAVEASETWVLAQSAFHELLRRDEALRDSLMAGLTRELRRLTAQVEELHFLDLAGRLAKRLARLARDVAGDDAAGPVSLDWPFTQADLAAMIGGTRQSVNRLLSELIDDGLLRIESERLLIADLARLEERAER